MDAPRRGPFLEDPPRRRRMRRRTSAWIVSVGFGLVIAMNAGCGGPKGKASSPAPAPVEGSAQPGFNPITKIAPGMTMLDVLRDLPPPRDMKGNTYYYKGWGRIVFEGTKSPTDMTKVLKVEPDKMEDGIAPQN